MSNNFGDSLNYEVVKYLSGKEPTYTDNRNEPHLICCGSILTEARDTSTVWGAGFAWYHDRLNTNANVISTRGYLSANNLENVPKYVGDPALFMPEIYSPKLDKKYSKSIIPHWKDLEKMLYFFGGTDIHIISPLKPVKEVIDDIVMSENILSSSLHGLILSDAYGVANRWLDVGTDIGGDGFKFLDYYSTTVNITQKPVNKISFESCTVNKSLLNLSELKKSFPA